MNRNFSVGSILDGFQGATFTDCLSGNYSGPFELSEPEVRNEVWVQTTFTNIKFINNIHSSGGLFMWPPGAYTPARVPLPYPPYGTLNFFDQTAKQVLDGIKSHRGTAILPQQTGPVIDVLYSAAGNSADEAYYAHGIIGYDFEIGATHYNDTGTGAATCGPGQQPPFGTNTTNPCLLNEGKHEGEEFASGNYGLLRSALQYSNDTAAAGRRHGREGRRDHADLLGQVHVQRGVARSTTRPTARRPRRPRPSGSRRAPARCRCRSSSRAGDDAEVDRPRLQGQRLGGQVARSSGRPTPPARSAAPCRRRWR